MLNKKNIIVIISLFILSSCIRINGIFAYKDKYMDYYKKFENGISFNQKREINWVYKIDKISKKTSIGVVVLKKELVWIDVIKYSYTVDLLKPNVYGKIENLEPGMYKIVLMHENDMIDSINFKIYEDE